MSGEVLPCEAIIGEFVYGPIRCNAPSTAEAIDATWGTIHPVCAKHDPEEVTEKRHGAHGTGPRSAEQPRSDQRDRS